MREPYSTHTHIHMKFDFDIPPVATSVNNSLETQNYCLLFTLMSKVIRLLWYFSGMMSILFQTIESISTKW